MATVLTGPAVGAKLLLFADGATAGALGDAGLDEAVRARAPICLASLQSERLTVETAAGPIDIFIDVQPPQPRLWMVGAVHIAVALATYARPLGFRTIVLDPRTAFATPARFAHADITRLDSTLVRLFDWGKAAGHKAIVRLFQRFDQVSASRVQASSRRWLPKSSWNRRLWRPLP